MLNLTDGLAREQNMIPRRVVGPTIYYFRPIPSPCCQYHSFCSIKKKKKTSQKIDVQRCVATFIEAIECAAEISVSVSASPPKFYFQPHVLHPFEAYSCFDSTNGPRGFLSQMGQTSSQVQDELSEPSGNFGKCPMTKYRLVSRVSKETDACYDRN